MVRGCRLSAGLAPGCCARPFTSGRATRWPGPSGRVPIAITSAPGARPIMPPSARSPSSGFASCSVTGKTARPMTSRPTSSPCEGVSRPEWRQPRPRSIRSGKNVGTSGHPQTSSLDWNHSDDFYCVRSLSGGGSTARNTTSSCSASTCTTSPGRKAPSSSFSPSGRATSRSMARASGRAPFCGS
jgi:hypothetical protein